MCSGIERQALGVVVSCLYGTGLFAQQNQLHRYFREQIIYIASFSYSNLFTFQIKTDSSQLKGNVHL